MKRRVVVFVSSYPQVSETYIKNEIDALASSFDVEIVSFQPGSFPYRSRRPHIVATAENQHNVVEYLRRFKPDALHGHYLVQLPNLLGISQILGVPFTVRAHSFDVLGIRTAPHERTRADHDALSFIAQAAASPLFRGVLCFPFMRERMIAAGMPADRVFACNPIIDVERFRDRGPNGRAVMNVGAALPKKKMDDFVMLSRLVPEREFNLYALGYRSQELEELNRKHQGRVRFVPPVDPEDMPGEYKKHAWLVYTASPEMATVGWPMAVVEAMASGVGACMQDIRPDLKQYVGDAGVLFRTPGELTERLKRDPTPDERERGFAWAEQFDLRKQLPLLTSLW
ncbi:MAG: glycosyltransferase [Vicinamibacteria bacterium]|jgi:glycosyltransferase involved in cell wall biosynthesis